MDPEDQTGSLKTQTDLLMRQVSSDFQHRIRNVASLVMGRLVRSESLNTQAKSALTNYCKTPKRRHLGQFLHKQGCQKPQRPLPVILMAFTLQVAVSHAVYAAYSV